MSVAFEQHKSENMKLNKQTNRNTTKQKKMGEKESAIVVGTLI